MNKESIKSLPELPGVYIFRDIEENIIYVGKSKNIKNRVSSYFNKNENLKTKAIQEYASKIEYMITQNEVEALLLEAKLVKSYQPKFNVLLKNGEPYIYILFTKDEIKLSRDKKEQGQYFGPFIEKSDARRTFNFLINTFNLRLCNKKIPNGCLYYHIGKCAGSCKEDFDKKSYLSRLEIAKQVLKKEHKDFLEHIKNEIKKSNEELNFEKSKELNSYYQSCSKTFSSIKTKFSKRESFLSFKQIWIQLKDSNSLFLFEEKNLAIKKKRIFILTSDEAYTKFKSFYQSQDCPQGIITNFEINNKKAFETFLKKWHKKTYPISISCNPKEGHIRNLLSLAKIMAEKEISDQNSLSKDLKNLLKVNFLPKTIDCFDISHKQGLHMVGSCIRFLNGKPDKNNFRKFKIKTINTQDDYAALKEIVRRRYKNNNEIPDIVLIDGGKGQLSAVKDLFPEATFISLAKKEETIFSDKIPNGKKLNIKNYADQLLIAIRDYSHHFAISYHKNLSLKNLK